MALQLSYFNQKIKPLFLVVFLIVLLFKLIDLYNKNRETEKILMSEKQEIMNGLVRMEVNLTKTIDNNSFTNERLIQNKNEVMELMEILKVSETSMKNILKYKTRYINLFNKYKRVISENRQINLDQDWSNLPNKLDVSEFKDSIYFKNLEEKKEQIATGTIKEITQQEPTETPKVQGSSETATLKANGISGRGIIQRSNGNQKETDVAKRSDRLKICFSVAKNTQVPSGDKTFYIQVLDPSKRVLGTNRSVNINDKTIHYSVASNFYYINENLDICEYINKPVNNGFTSGTYNISLFNGADKISSTSLNLK